MKLSILIPVFNEEKTIGEILKRVEKIAIPQVKKEIIVIDDHSTDTSAKIVSNFINKNKRSTIKLIKHAQNLGKGTAVRTGIEAATGEYVIIQDADLEYNPQDIPRLWAALQEHTADVIYGTRLKRLPNFKRDERRIRFFLHYLGNKSLSLFTSLLYGQWITDMETCYKVMPKKVLRTLSLHAKGFEFEPEITAKLLKRGMKIIEIPISTNPRGYDEGKKLHTIRDGIKALRALLTYRFVD
jgi:glycosyltransferase involved in cell wall biosynthesis